MIEDMPNIDLSGIDALRELKEEQGTLHVRIDKMNAKKGKVSESVFEKVHQDYADRLHALETKAAPLKNEVRAEYAKLRSLIVSLTEALETVRFEKEELEFRHELGEYEGDNYEDVLGDCETRLTERQAELDEADQLKAKFLEVFDSEEDLNAGIEEIEPEPEAESEPEPEPEAGAEPEPDDADSTDEPSTEEPDEDADGSDEAGQAETDDKSDDDSDDEADSDAAPIYDFSSDDDDEPEDASAADAGPGEGENQAEIEYSEALMAEIEREQAAQSSDGDASDGDASDGDDDGEPEELSEADLVDEPPLQAGPDEETMAGVPAQDMLDQAGVNDTNEMRPPMPPPVPSMGEPATMKLDKSQFDWSTPPEDEVEGTMIITNPKIISVVDGEEKQVYALGMGTTSIGRSPDNDIHIPEERVSRKHAQIAFGPGGYAIYDLNSENGTYVNGNRVREHFLMEGDVLLIGTNQFLYRER